MRILIVDDEEPIREALSAWLIKDGYQVNTADSGLTALACIEEGLFDLYLVDIKMPGMDGLGVCRVLRARGDRTPVLMLTARDTLEDKLEGFSRGADDYLVKPTSPGVLRARHGAGQGLVQVVVAIRIPVT